MKKHSKMYVEALSNIEKNKSYDDTEAIKVLKSLKPRKFDESVDLVLKLNIDAKKTDQNIRGSFVLPNGTGKTKRVLVVTKTKAAEAEAQAAKLEEALEEMEESAKAMAEGASVEVESTEQSKEDEEKANEE